VSIKQSTILTPRDLASLSELKQHGLFLVEVKISKVSATLGQRLEGVGLPERTHPICVIRKGEVTFDLHPLFLAEGDSVYLITDDETAVRSLFTV
jgi:NhaP-type Na+/H+ and K+/H+ antiporter